MHFRLPYICEYLFLIRYTPIKERMYLGIFQECSITNYIMYKVILGASQTFQISQQVYTW